MTLSGRRTTLLALGAYTLVAFLVLGLPVLVESGPQYVGHGYDPQIFIWAFAWWPHAILHGENPFVTHSVWAPQGVDLAWTTTVPGLALLFSPLTLLVGPIVSYDVAAVLMPALAAWTAYLLCRYLTRSFWPALLGGYLFGFSSYVLAQGGGGHLHLSAVCAIPLIALVVLRFLDGGLAGRGLVLRLGPLIALELLLSTEVVFTFSLGLALALLLGFALVPERRHRIVSLLPPLAVAYVVAAVLTAPFVYYLLDGFQSGGFVAADGFDADLLNFVVPSKITMLGGPWLKAVSNHFPGNSSEQDDYLGIPLLVIVCLYAVERLRRPGGRFLVACFGLCVLLALGHRATIDGRNFIPLPWNLVAEQPLFRDVLTERLALYTTLVAALMAALWTAGRTHGALRFVLPALAVLALVPNPQSGGFATTYHVPVFFTDSAYKSCLDPGETVVPFPFRGGAALLWQTDRDFRFDMAGGDIGPSIPAPFLAPEAIAVTGGGPLGADQTANLRTFFAEHGVTTVVLDASQASQWSAALDPIARPRRVGGVVLYRLAPYPPPCPATSP